MDSSTNKHDLKSLRMKSYICKFKKLSAKNLKVFFFFNHIICHIDCCSQEINNYNPAQSGALCPLSKILTDTGYEKQQTKTAVYSVFSVLFIIHITYIERW